jgi:Peptidase family M48
VIPPHKDLHIGLGLVNAVNLTEFKAVLAHEFGHFAQQSIGLTSYLYVANQVMHDVLYSRDAFDRFVDRWSEQDIRIAFPALGLKLALAGVRKMLGGLYHGLNVLHLSLSREMEFNADNVAIRLTGSDAPIHVLARLPFAAECLADAASSLSAAADHELFTDDLFYHQSRSAERLRRVRKKPRLGLPPDHASEDEWVFRPEKDDLAEKYSTHPSDHAREQNAKRDYVPGPRDDRSPWILFRGATDLRREVTDIFYRKLMNRPEWYTQRPAAEVQAFIDAEHAEMTYDPRYHGWYDERFINPGDVELPPLKPWVPSRITAWLSDWPPADLGPRVERLRELQEDERVLSGIQSGAVQIEGRTFDYRDRQYSRRDVRRLLAEVQEELKSILQSFTDLDQQAYKAHWSLATHLDREDARGRVTDLGDRYRFHMTIQRLFSRFIHAQGQLQNVFDFLSRNAELAQEDFFEVQSILQDIQDSLKEAVMDARRVKIPELSNVEDGMRLDELIADRNDTRLRGLSANSIRGEYLMGLANRLDAMLGRLRRLHFKSLGGLLACQERLAAEWAAQAQPAVAEPVSEVSLAVPVATGACQLIAEPVSDVPVAVPVAAVPSQRLLNAMQRLKRPAER